MCDTNLFIKINVLTITNIIIILEGYDFYVFKILVSCWASMVMEMHTFAWKIQLHLMHCYYLMFEFFIESKIWKVCKMHFYEYDANLDSG
jgi:hypothetical protein